MKLNTEYTVKILDDQEFENLPFPETDVSFGIADPRTNTAYVRYTPNQDVMNYLVNHEIEHLIEGHGGEHSDHYRNGVYYKGFGEMFSGGQQQQQAPMQTLGGAISNAIGGVMGKVQQQNYDKYQQSMKPNVFSTGPGDSSNFGSSGLNPDTISRIKGFFAGRNPSQGGF